MRMGTQGRQGWGVESKRKVGAGLHTWYLEVNEDGGNQHPKALQEVSQHVHKGRPDAGVPQGQGLPGPLLQRCILCPPRPVAVGRPSLVQHKSHSEGEAEQLSPGGLLLASSTHFHAPSSHLPGALSPPVFSLFSQSPEESNTVQERQTELPGGRNTWY